MKCISLWQPWATLWVLQIKKNETRHWPFPSNYTGPVAVHAAKKKVNIWDGIERYFLQGIIEALDKAGLDPNYLPRGAIVGRCDRIRSYKIFRYQNNSLETMLGDWSPGRYYWTPENMQPLPEPIPYRGCQGIFNVDLFSDRYIPPPKRQQLKLF